MKSGMSSRSLIAACLCLVLAASATADALTIFRVATTKDDEGIPTVSGNIVVWQDQSNGTWDIHGYNLVTRQELTVTNLRMSEQVNPAVYVDTRQKRAIIVWQGNRDGNWDVYGAVVDGPEVEAQPSR